MEEIMISDILSQMVDDLDPTSTIQLTTIPINGTMWERIVLLREEAEYIRFVLDTHTQNGICRKGSFVSRSREMGTEIASFPPPLLISPTPTPAKAAR
jgi:hypothetical protein